MYFVHYYDGNYIIWYILEGKTLKIFISVHNRYIEKWVLMKNMIKSKCWLVKSVTHLLKYFQTIAFMRFNMIVIDTSHPIVCYLLKNNYLVTTSTMVFFSIIDIVYFDALDTSYLSAISVKKVKKIRLQVYTYRCNLQQNTCNRLSITIYM